MLRFAYSRRSRKAIMLYFIELAFFFTPICFGHIVDIPGTEEVTSEKFVVQADTRRFLQPTISIRTGPPMITEITAGGTKILECEAGGSPPPTIHWLKDGRKIVQSLYEAIHPSKNGGEVVLSHLGLGFTRSRLHIDCASSLDSGKYTCVAENAYRRESKIGQVHVINSLTGESNGMCMAKKNFGTPARVHMWTHTRLEVMGTDVQLFCRTSGEPEPQIMWRGPNRETLSDPQKYQVLNNGDLIIRDIEWSDMGGYTCHASNSDGSDETLVFLYPTLPENEKVTKG